MTRMSEERRAPRGRLEGATRIRLPRATPGSILGVAAAVMIGVLGAATAAGGSFAYLNAVAPVGPSGSTVSAGTSSLTLQASGGAAGGSITMPAAAWNRMLPGDLVGQTVTVANTGATPLSLTARISAASAWGFRSALGACPTSTISGAALTTSASATLGTLAAGASATLCIQTLLPAAAPASAQGSSPAVTLILDGTQVAG